MLFSIVIPACNRPDLLFGCLSRLAPGGQSAPLSDYEVIVSDDSRGRSVERMVAENFSSVRWVSGPRRGAAPNRNAGAAAAAGEWIIFLDDDCLPDRGWIEAYAAAARSFASASVLEGRTTAGTEGMGALETAPVNEAGGCLWSCNFAIRRVLFLQLGGFDEALGSNLEDVDLRVRLEQAGIRAQFVPEALVVHPPRALRPLFRQVMEHKTYFRFAQKHRVSLREAGLHWRGYAVWRLHFLRRSRNAGEALRFLGRCLVEAVLLAPLCAWWALTVRSPK